MESHFRFFAERALVYEEQTSRRFCARSWLAAGSEFKPGSADSLSMLFSQQHGMAGPKSEFTPPSHSESSGSFRFSSSSRELKASKFWRAGQLRRSEEHTS